MSRSSAPEKALLFLNNLAGDDWWENGHLMLPEYEKYAAPLELFRFKRASRRRYTSEGVYGTSVPYTQNGYGKIQLYGFPFLAIDVDPFDIDYPLPIQGLVITEDMRMYDHFMERDPRFFNLTGSQHSRLAWAKSHNLPTLLAVHHAEDHYEDLHALSKLVGMELFCPVVWHAGETNPDFLHLAVEALLSEIKQV